MSAPNPRYALMDFPDVGYQEYPKMVYPKKADPTVPAEQIKRLHPSKPAAHNQGVLVHNAEEEKLAMSGAVLQREGDEKADLLKRAEHLAVKIDARWGVEKIRAAIDEAEAALNEA